MRTLILILIFLVAAVYFVQATVAGYDSQFSAPGPLRTWQVQAAAGREVVTVWGQSFNLPPDEVPELVHRAGPYVDRLLDARGLLDRGRAALGTFLRPGSQ